MRLSNGPLWKSLWLWPGTSLGIQGCIWQGSQWANCSMIDSSMIGVLSLPWPTSSFQEQVKGECYEISVCPQLCRR